MGWTNNASRSIFFSLAANLITTDEAQASAFHISHKALRHSTNKQMNICGLEHYLASATDETNKVQALSLAVVIYLRAVYGITFNSGSGFNLEENRSRVEGRISTKH